MGWFFLIQIGQDLQGEAAGDCQHSNNSVSLSSNDILAIGSPQNDGNGNNSGHVRVFEWNGNSWNQLGLDIDEAPNDWSETFVSLNNNGTILAVGAPMNDNSSLNSNYAESWGQVRIFNWDGNSWNQLGVEINGQWYEDKIGEAISLNGDGTIIAIGAPYSVGDDNIDNVRIHTLVCLVEGCTNPLFAEFNPLVVQMIIPALLFRV